MPITHSRPLTARPALARIAAVLVGTAWRLTLATALVTALASAAAASAGEEITSPTTTGSYAEPNGDPRRQALDDLLHNRTEAGFRGVVLVSEGDEVVLHEAYGRRDPEQPEPMPRDAVFTLGSIAKPFTALLVLQLEEEGQLRVDDPIDRHLPDVPSDKQAITLHHLLTHSAGFPGALGEDFDFIARDSFVDLAFGTPLLFEPGERYEYSNVGYSLLAAIVERRTGRPFEEVLRQRVLEPAGMRDTGFDPALWPTDRLAHGGGPGGRWGTVVERFGPRGPSWHLVGNGGLHSTASDMLRFHRALEGNLLLSESAKTRAFGRQMPEDEAGSSHYGYGWTVFDTPQGGTVLAHNGGNRIFFADFQRHVDDDLMVFLAAAQPMQGLFVLAEEIARRLADPEAAETSTPAPRE